MMSATLAALRLLPPEMSHRAALLGLKAAASAGLIRADLTSFPFYSPTNAMGLNFPNPLGIAAGMDKDGEFINALGALGFGFIEVGTVTPQPQAGNARPRIFRLPESRALINRLGFPSIGADKVADNLRRQKKYSGILGISVGKNAATPSHQTIDDYLFCIDKLHPFADYFAINISSPNTEGLRELQKANQLRQLLNEVAARRDELAKNKKRIPLAVKMSPDLDDNAIAEFARAVADCGGDAVIAVNTTTDRPCQMKKIKSINEKGGLSGEPLKEKAMHAMRKLRLSLPKEFPIIGVGGVMSAEDARMRFLEGASLVQIYTGLIYRGPSLAREIIAGKKNATRKAGINPRPDRLI